MWHRFNPNPRGSSVGDCAVRAVAAATGRSWEQAYIALALTGYALGDMPTRKILVLVFSFLSFVVRLLSLPASQNGTLDAKGGERHVAQV